MLNSSEGLKKIAITGGLSSGKSSVCLFLRKLGCYVISADEIVHELLSKNQDIIQKVIKLLGTDILINNQIDRPKIAKKVFSQPLLLKSLEKILHPVVQKEINKQYELKRKDGLTSLFVAEIPLLFEQGSDADFDFVVVVGADEDLRKERFKLATSYALDEFEKRQSRQLSMQEKLLKADYVIRNNGSLIDLQHSVDELYKKLTEINFFKHED